jgi:tRNA dimethylallyltransferase
MTGDLFTSRVSRFTTELKPVVVIAGPTAVGKSRIGALLAQALGTEVLTADSRQVYRGMDIGMDKPSLDERRGIPHRLIDLVEPDEPFNAGLFRRRALAEIERLYGEGRVPLVVGGTGLYIRTLLRGLWEGPVADWSLRARLMETARAEGPESLHRELARVDPESAGRLHPRDQVKIIRALEVHHLSGRPLSEAHRAHSFGERPFSPLLLGLTRERASLYRRIEARVEEQLAKGLVEETRRLLDRGYGRHLGSMKGLGYRQIAGYLAGEYSYEEAVRRLKRDTRHFAKRQLTWFRKEPGLVWVRIEERESPEQVAARLLELVERFLSELTASVRSGAGPAATGTDGR